MSENYYILKRLRIRLGGKIMAEVKGLLRVEADGTLSFGDYTLATKTKLDEFEYQGDYYKVKTFSEITKLEKNGMFVYESVPGTAVHNLKITEESVTFVVYAREGVQFTIGLEENSLYEVYLDDMSVGSMKTHLSGKLSVSVETKGNTGVEVKIVKR